MSLAAGSTTTDEKEFPIPLLGIDVGTSATRVVIVAEDGRLLAAATSDHAPFTSVVTGGA